MRCHICDSELSNISFNRDHGDINPCGTCLQIISEVFGEEGDDDETEVGDIEPTAEEMMKDVEDLAYGRFDVV